MIIYIYLLSFKSFLTGSWVNILLMIGTMPVLIKCGFRVVFAFYINAVVEYSDT